MPLYKTITVSNNTTVYLWKVQETEAYLANHIHLTAHCQRRVEGMKSELHRRAFLSIRHLLVLAGYEDKHLFYDEFGKPHLVDGNHISITHSHEFTGIIISTSREVGIDIERQRDKILRIAHKFTPLEEYRTLANTSALIQKLTIVWGAKESLYKIYAQPGLSFLKHIDVNDFSMESKETTAVINYRGHISRYDVFFMDFEGFVCTYALRSS